MRMSPIRFLLLHPTDSFYQSALEVLAALREVEERFRLPLSNAYDALSDGSGGLGARSTQSPIPCKLEPEHPFHEGDLSNTYSMIPVQVGDRLGHVPVWEDEESNDNGFFDENRRERTEKD